MVHSVMILILLMLVRLIELHELALHPLVLQQLHAILLVEVDELNLMILLLDIIIVILSHIFAKVDLIAFLDSAFIKVIMYFTCLICTGSQIHRIFSEIKGFHRAVMV